MKHRELKTIQQSEKSDKSGLGDLSRVNAKNLKLHCFLEICCGKQPFLTNQSPKYCQRLVK